VLSEFPKDMFLQELVNGVVRLVYYQLLFDGNVYVHSYCYIHCSDLDIDIF
jgi:hypothetical protein